MPEDERRTIEELVTRYEFEPNLKDIYVEGPEDKAILEGMLEEHQIAGVYVFEISSVDVPTELGEETSSRMKLVKLARELVGALQGKRLRLACVIDSDFDYITGHLDNNAFLLSTDYANMEMYFFSSGVFERLNRQCLRGRRITAHMIDNFMVPTLQSLFLIRYVNSTPDWHMKYLPFEKLLSFRRGHFDFNRDEYIRRYLSRNGRLSELAEFRQEIEAVGIPCGLDARCFMHGHDFLALLRRMLNNLRGRNVYGNDEVVFSILRACADYKALAQGQMFATILWRFGQAPNNGIDHDQ